MKWEEKFPGLEPLERAVTETGRGVFYGLDQGLCVCGALSFFVDEATKQHVCSTVCLEALIESGVQDGR